MIFATIWHFIVHLVQFMYLPYHAPFYNGAVWSNVFVVIVIAPLTWLWSKTRFWPLRPLKHLHKRVEELHAKHDLLAQSLTELHDKHDALHAKIAQSIEDAEGESPQF